MTDHDQRFKVLIEAFFEAFFRLFFAKWADRLDCAAVEWLPQEIFTDPPQGRRGVLDLVGKVPTFQAVTMPPPGGEEKFLTLVHIEIESPDKATPARWRMHDAYTHLRRKHGLPVLPICLFLKVGLEGIGIDTYEEHFWELHTVKFQYLYVGLPGLDAVQYVQGDNWLGVALSALMKIPADKVAWLGAEALRRLQAAPLTDQQRFLLGECVQAYLPLDEAQKQEFEHLTTTEPYKGVQAMNVTWYEQGMEKGIEKGIEKGRREAFQALLEARFGPLPSGVRERVDKTPADQLPTMLKTAVRADSLKDLGFE